MGQGVHAVLQPAAARATMRRRGWSARVRGWLDPGTPRHMPVPPRARPSLRAPVYTFGDQAAPDMSASVGSVEAGDPRRSVPCLAETHGRVI